MSRTYYTGYSRLRPCSSLKARELFRISSKAAATVKDFFVVCIGNAAAASLDEVKPPPDSDRDFLEHVYVVNARRAAADPLSFPSDLRARGGTPAFQSRGCRTQERLLHTACIADAAPPPRSLNSPIPCRYKCMYLCVCTSICVHISMFANPWHVSISVCLYLSAAGMSADN